MFNPLQHRLRIGDLVEVMKFNAALLRRGQVVQITESAQGTTARVLREDGSTTDVNYDPVGHEWRLAPETVARLAGADVIDAVRLLRSYNELTLDAAVAAIARARGKTEAAVRADLAFELKAFA